MCQLGLLETVMGIFHYFLTFYIDQTTNVKKPNGLIYFTHVSLFTYCWKKNGIEELNYKIHEFTWNLIQNNKNISLWETNKRNQTQLLQVCSVCRPHNWPRTSSAPPWLQYKGRLQSLGWQLCARPSWANPQTASSHRGTYTRVSTSPRSYRETSCWSYSALWRLFYDTLMKAFLTNKWVFFICKHCLDLTKQCHY